MIQIYLTHPDFSKLAGAEPLFQFEWWSWDFPGVFLPRLLRFGAQARAGQGLAEAISLLWNKQKKYFPIWFCFVCMFLYNENQYYDALIQNIQFHKSFEHKFILMLVLIKEQYNHFSNDPDGVSHRLRY